MLGGATPELAVTGRRLMALMVDAKLLRAESAISKACSRRDRCADASRKVRAMCMRFPASLNFTVPLILLGFAATLSAVNLLYHVPQAEREAEEDSRKRLAQEMSRLQSTLEYLLLKGDMAAAQHEIAVLAHNHDVIVAALTDDRNTVIAATRRAWLGRQIADVLPQFDLEQAAGAIRERRAGMTIDSNGNELLGHAGILMGSEREELRPSRTGSVFLAYDLKRYKAEARAQVLQQSLYWAGWVTALALAMWLVFHFLLTRRTARLVHAAEQLAAGNLSARSGLKGSDELGRLSRAFDAMALVGRICRPTSPSASAPTRRCGCRRRAIGRFSMPPRTPSSCIDIETGAIVDVNPKACATFGYTPRRIPAASTSARSAPASIPIRSKTRWSCSRARRPASSCASNGMARARTAVCAGTRCSSSA